MMLSQLINDEFGSWEIDSLGTEKSECGSCVARSKIIILISFYSLPLYKQRTLVELSQRSIFKTTKLDAPTQFYKFLQNPA